MVEQHRYDPREYLREINNDPEIRSLTHSRTLLTWDRLGKEAPQLRERLSHDGSFHDLVDLIGWPDHRDGDIIPHREYRDVKEFQRNLTSLSSEFGGKKKGLNNFRVFLEAKPLTADESPDDAHYFYKYYIAQPFAMRAYAIAPDLFDTLRDVTLSRPENGGQSVFADPVVADAAWTAYRLMGRLVRPSDARVHSQLIRRHSAEVKDIVDVHVALVE